MDFPKINQASITTTDPLGFPIFFLLHAFSFVLSGAQILLTLIQIRPTPPEWTIKILSCLKLPSRCMILLSPDFSLSIYFTFSALHLALWVTLEKRPQLNLLVGDKPTASGLNCYLDLRATLQCFPVFLFFHEVYSNSLHFFKFLFWSF